MIMLQNMVIMKQTHTTIFIIFFKSLRRLKLVMTNYTFRVKHFHTTRYFYESIGYLSSFHIKDMWTFITMETPFFYFTWILLHFSTCFVNKFWLKITSVIFILVKTSKFVTEFTRNGAEISSKYFFFITT